MRILLVGGTGTIGRAVDAALTGRGHDVGVVSRSSRPAIDTSTDAGIDEILGYIAEAGPVDAVVSTFGSTPFEPFGELTAESYRSAFEGKTLPQIRLALRAAEYLADGGSITLSTGITARTPVATGAASSVASGAVEAFVMAAATGLPRGIRINAVSPSVVLESPDNHAAFPGFEPVPAERVALSYVRSVENVETGQVLVP